MQEDWHTITRRWLARLSFSFLAIALILGWDAYKRVTTAGGVGGGVDGRTLLEFVGAALSLGAGVHGVG